MDPQAFPRVLALVWRRVYCAGFHISAVAVPRAGGCGDEEDRSNSGLGPWGRLETHLSNRLDDELDEKRCRRWGDRQLLARLTRRFVVCSAFPQRATVARTAATRVHRSIMNSTPKVFQNRRNKKPTTTKTDDEGNERTTGSCTPSRKYIRQLRPTRPKPL